jgi:CRISPR-associated protein Cmr5
MKAKTRAQNDLILAAQLVGEVEVEEEKVQKIYGALCHSFPVLVRTCGLCQAIAFSADKLSSRDENRKKAHQLLLQHVAQVLGRKGADPLPLIRDASAAEYILYSRRILSSWIYFKRFAASILKVESPQEAEEGGE